MSSSHLSSEFGTRLTYREQKEFLRKMGKFVIRILMVALALAMLCATVNCRFVHAIEDYDQPMNEIVAVCRKGCLIKVCIFFFLNFSRRH